MKQVHSLFGEAPLPPKWFGSGESEQSSQDITMLRNDSSWIHISLEEGLFHCLFYPDIGNRNQPQK